MALPKTTQPETVENSADDRSTILHEVSLFADVKDNPAALRELGLFMKEKHYEPSSAIITEGETGGQLFILVKGQASVFKSTAEGDEYKVAILDGKLHVFFGEGGLLDSEARSATIRAESQCHCLILDREAFEKFSAEHPDWALPIFMKIARTVMGRLRKSNHDLMLLYNALVAEVRGH